MTRQLTILALVCLIALPALAESYTAIHLGTLGGDTSYAADVNDLDVVVGYSKMVEGSTHAFAWTLDTGMIDLGTLGGDESRAFAVNNRNEVVGYSTVRSGQRHAFIWTHQGGMQDLGTPDDQRSQAYDINDAGQVVGIFETRAGGRAFRWTREDGWEDLGVVALPSSWAYGINSRGDVVGQAASMNGEVGFLWTGATGMEGLPVIEGGNRTEAHAINDDGIIVGYSYLGIGPQGQRQHAVVWVPDVGLIDLGTLGGSKSNANDINGDGTIVGYSAASSHAADGGFIRRRGGEMVSLNDVVETEEFARLTNATAINESGHIAGQGLYWLAPGHTSFHACLLVPSSAGDRPVKAQPAGTNQTPGTTSPDGGE